MSAEKTDGGAARIRRFFRERRGAGAVEFALIAPALIVLYIGALEISVAMSANKKVARAASTVADLVTQQPTVTKTFLSSMVDVSESIIAPFSESPVKLKITAIEIDKAKKATVKWSWDQDGKRPYSHGSSTTVPNDLAIANSFLVRTEINYDHLLLLVVPGAKSINANTLTLNKTYYLRQRLGSSISCTNC